MHRLLLTIILLFLIVGNSVYSESRNIKEEYTRKLPLSDKIKRAYDAGVLKKGQKSYAFIIGISDYDIKNGWGQIDCAFKDAQKMCSFFKNEAEFDHVITLTNDSATKPTITYYMEEKFPKKVKQGDRFIFYFSGHGTQRSLPGNKKRGYLVMKSSKEESWGNMISMDNISNWYKNLQNARHILFILDCCFSGLAGTESKGNEGKRRFLLKKDFEKKGHHLMTAGTSGQITFGGDNWNGSLFTDALIKGMRGDADTKDRKFDYDGIVSLKELAIYVNNCIKLAVSEGKSENMTPQIRNLSTENIGEFFFITENIKAGKVSESDQHQKNIHFKRKGPATTQGFGNTLVYTDPSDAQLTIDGKNRGTTPVRVGNLSVGSHEIVIHKDGFVEYNDVIEIAPNELTMENYSLEQAAYLNVTTMPDSAMVLLNGEMIDHITPISNLMVTPQTYEVTLIKDKYDTVTSRINIEPGDNYSIDETMFPKYSSVDIRTFRIDSSFQRQVFTGAQRIEKVKKMVELDLEIFGIDESDSVVKFKTPFLYDMMCPGTYRIKVNDIRYENVEKTIILEKGKLFIDSIMMQYTQEFWTDSIAWVKNKRKVRLNVAAATFSTGLAIVGGTAAIVFKNMMSENHEKYLTAVRKREMDEYFNEETSAYRNMIISSSAGAIFLTTGIVFYIIKPKKNYTGNFDVFADFGKNSGKVGVTLEIVRINCQNHIHKGLYVD